MKQTVISELYVQKYELLQLLHTINANPNLPTARTVDILITIQNEIKYIEEEIEAEFKQEL